MNGLDPSLLDKLFDDNPRQVSGPEAIRPVSVEQYKATVARDLEGLLNSRSAMSEADLAGFRHCRRSLLTYGLNDFSSMSLANAHDRAAICNSLEAAIARHERRLQNVRVQLDSASQLDGGLRFTIHAILDLHPAREAVSFDAMLQPSTLQYSVSRLRRTNG